MIQQTIGGNINSANRGTEILAIGMGVFCALLLIVFGLVLVSGIHSLYKTGWVLSERVIAVSFWTLFVGLLCGLVCAVLSWVAQKSLRLLARNSALAMVSIVVIVAIQILMSLGGVALLWWQGAALFALVLIGPLVIARRGWRNQMVGVAAFIGATLAEVSVALLLFADI